MRPSTTSSSNPRQATTPRAAGPLVSIVIPCYRQAHFLSEAIESALSQTYPEVEVIVVNDGSPDDVRGVAERHRSVRVVEQPNGGLAAARNTGLREARGEFVVFLDADDRLLPEAVRLNVERMKSDPRLGFVSGNSRFISREGAPLETMQRPRPEGDMYAEMLRRNRIRMPAAVMFRRAVLDVVGDFDGRVNACADYDMYLRVSRRFPVAFHEEVVAEYRRHADNMSLDAALMLRQLTRVMRRQWWYVLGNRERRAALRAGVRNIRDYYGDRLADRIRERVRRRTDLGRALAYTLTLIVYHPRGAAAHAFRKAANTARGNAAPLDGDCQDSDQRVSALPSRL